MGFNSAFKGLKHNNGALVARLGQKVKINVKVKVTLVQALRLCRPYGPFPKGIEV